MWVLQKENDPTKVEPLKRDFRGAFCRKTKRLVWESGEAKRL
jgi:hypothetical protein